MPSVDEEEMMREDQERIKIKRHRESNEYLNIWISGSKIGPRRVTEVEFTVQFCGTKIVDDLTTHYLRLS
jgi:hypothetical protein